MIASEMGGGGADHPMRDQARPTPFDVLFRPWAEERFAAVREALRAAGTDPTDRDAFLLDRAVVELLRDLRPDEGYGEGMEAFVAFVHAAWLHWHTGFRVGVIGPRALAEVIARAAPAGGAPTPAESLGPCWYAQLPERRVWGQPVADQAHEPLDGLFLQRRAADLDVVGVFGLHPGRSGVSVVHVRGAPPGAELCRVDGTPLFAPVLPGGASAGLFGLTGMEELLALGWRLDALGARAAWMGHRQEWS